MADRTSGENQFCSYYQATVDRSHAWFVVATLKSFDHLCFDRTLDPATSLYEFFVPSMQQELFLAVMNELERKGLVTNLAKLTNRFTQPQ